MKQFGLDYDNTAGDDIDLWRLFVSEAQKRGHIVFIVTARFDNNIADIAAAFPELDVIATGGKPKREFCMGQGVEIDVWIDDMPEII